MWNCLITELKYELKLADARIEAQRDLLQYQRTDIVELKQLIDTALRNPSPIQIETTATSKLISNINVCFEIAPQISLIQGSLNELKENFPTISEEAKSISEIQDVLLNAGQQR